jgi:Helicase conserved C-terminal domain
VPRWAAPPIIVAEALVGVSDPLLTALQPGRVAAPAAVVAAIARSLASPEDSHPSPGWLLPQQIPSFRRVLWAIRRYQGALLADPVGSGKTYVALAVASVLNRGVTACLVPAALVGQWQRTAAQLGIPVVVASHEQVSRGRLPRRTRGLVLVDESHHYRTPGTQRYCHLAPWLVGRAALLVSATPIVNRVEDLSHQLLLAIRDNALAGDGVVSIRSMLAGGTSCSALGRIVVDSAACMQSRPTKICRISAPGSQESREAVPVLELVDGLRFSRLPTIARLIRSVFLRAAASSPAALAGALRRYRKLLLHARDSLTAGRSFSRTELQAFTGGLEDQLVWWELFAPSQELAEVDLGDLDTISGWLPTVDRGRLVADEKVNRLRRILENGVPSLVFTTWRETVSYIRNQLPEFRLAWCTGMHAGIGTGRIARKDVLAWFQGPTSIELAPQHLVVTDVAAEGLDLQRAGRVIHYDLPWTPMRLEQREGRSIRLGSPYPMVEIIRFQPEPGLEARIRSETTLTRKLELPAHVGLGSSGRRVWRWRSEVAERFRGKVYCPGVAWVPYPEPGVLAGFGVHRSGESVALSTTVVWAGPDGIWTDTPEVIEPLLEHASRVEVGTPIPLRRLDVGMASLAQPIRERLALTRGRRWITPEPSPPARALLVRLQGLLREASRRHQPGRLAQLQQTAAFVADGHTAGELILIERLAAATESQVIAGARQSIRTSPQWDDVEAQLTGLLLFGPPQPIRTELASPKCQTSPPPSLISTEP